MVGIADAVVHGFDGLGAPALSNLRDSSATAAITRSSFSNRQPIWASVIGLLLGVPNSALRAAAACAPKLFLLPFVNVSQRKVSTNNRHRSFGSARIAGAGLAQVLAAPFGSLRHFQFYSIKCCALPEMNASYLEFQPARSHARRSPCPNGAQRPNAHVFIFRGYSLKLDTIVFISNISRPSFQPPASHRSVHALSPSRALFMAFAARYSERLTSPPRRAC